MDVVCPSLALPRTLLSRSSSVLSRNSTIKLSSTSAASSSTESACSSTSARSTLCVSNSSFSLSSPPDRLTFENRLGLQLSRYPAMGRRPPYVQRSYLFHLPISSNNLAQSGPALPPTFPPPSAPGFSPSPSHLRVRFALPARKASSHMRRSAGLGIWRH